MKKYGIYALFVGIGALAGYLYWFHVGCNSGSCAITSVWYNSSIAGALMGYLTGDLALDAYKKINHKKKENGETARKRLSTHI